MAESSKPLQIVKSPEAVGVSVGSLLVYLASWIDDPTYQQLALYSIPIASVFMSKLFYWIGVYGSRELRLFWAQRDLKRLQKHVDDIEKDVSSAEELKNKARAVLSDHRIKILELQSGQNLEKPRKRNG